MRKFHRRASIFDLPVIIDHDAWKSVKLRSVDKIDVGGDIKKEILITSVIPSSSKNRIRNDTCQNLLVFSLLFFFFYRDWSFYGWLKLESSNRKNFETIGIIIRLNSWYM